MQPVPLDSAVTGALELVRRPLLDQGVTVELALGEPPPILQAQEVLLDQLFSNLLRNACDALAERPPGAFASRPSRGRPAWCGSPSPTRAAASRPG